MRTIRPISAGDELFNDYGPLPRSDLLRRYGYITPNYAQYDVVEISAKSVTELAGGGLEEGDRMERIDYLLDEGVLDDAFDIGTDFEIPEEVLAFVGCLLLSREEFVVLKGKGKVPKARKSREVGKVLEEVLETRLAGYGSSVEEDEGILKDENVQGRKRVAVEIRLGEKKILKGALTRVKEWSQPVETAKRSESDAADGERAGKRMKVR